MCGLCSHRANGLITLFDDVLQLPQHCDLCVLKLLLLSGGVCYTSLVGGLRLICLCAHTHTNSLLLLFLCRLYLSDHLSDRKVLMKHFTQWQKSERVSLVILEAQGAAPWWAMKVHNSSFSNLFFKIMNSSSSGKDLKVQQWFSRALGKAELFTQPKLASIR